MLSDAERLAGLLPDEGFVRLIKAEIFGAQRGDGHQPVTAQPFDGGEEAEIGDAGDPRGDHLTHTHGEEGGDIAVHGLALRLHRAAFGSGDDLADELHPLGVVLGERGRFALRVQAVCPDERAVDDQIRITADGRGEVRVGPEREAEMAAILRAVIGLCLAAQDLLHHLGAELNLAQLIDQAVEGGGRDDLPQRKGNLKRRQIFLERDEFFAARRFMDAVHDRRLLRLQRLGRGDVGRDHVILDQLMRIEPFARRDRLDAAFLIQLHAAFGQVEVQRLALFPRLEQQRPTRP